MRPSAEGETAMGRATASARRMAFAAMLAATLAPVHAQTLQWELERPLPNSAPTPVFASGKVRLAVAPGGRMYASPVGAGWELPVLAIEPDGTLAWERLLNSPVNPVAGGGGFALPVADAAGAVTITNWGLSGMQCPLGACRWSALTRVLAPLGGFVPVNLSGFPFAQGWFSITDVAPAVASPGELVAVGGHGAPGYRGFVLRTGAGGVWIDDPEVSNRTVLSVADGDIVVAGMSAGGGVVKRYGPAGTLRWSRPSGTYACTQLVEEAAGNIACLATDGLQRWDPTGSPLPRPAALGFVATALAVGTRGDLWLAGEDGNTRRAVLGRVDAAGNLTTTRFDDAVLFSGFRALAVGPAGDVYATGWASGNVPPYPPLAWLIARFAADGTLVWRDVRAVPGAHAVGTDVAATGDGAFVAGYHDFGLGDARLVVRKVGAAALPVPAGRWTWSPQPPLPGSPAVLTLEITAASSSPSGTVTFALDGSQLCAAVALVPSGAGRSQASCPWPLATRGVHRVVATYGGSPSLGQATYELAILVADAPVDVPGMGPRALALTVLAVLLIAWQARRRGA